MSNISRNTVLPEFLEEKLREFAGNEAESVRALLRDPEEVMSVSTLSCFKASPVSFADMLLARMAKQQWKIERVSGEVDDEAAGRFVYRIDAGAHSFTYIARAYPWDGKEKVGRRADGAMRDMFGALFVNVADAARVAREFETFDMRDTDAMRTDADVIGWTPANRSSRHFDEVVNALVKGKQPDLEGKIPYILRNGGFQSSGRNGSISYPGIPVDHPLCHPFFADLFAIYLVRVVSIDLANAVAKSRNPNAAQLDLDLARHLGVGNSSGQGMCVALQRWPHWVATWVTQRELALAYAKNQPVSPNTQAALRETLSALAESYDGLNVPEASFMVPGKVLAANLREVQSWLQPKTSGRWSDFADKVAASMDGETREQINSALIELVPEFCEAISPYFVIGAGRQRLLEPAMPVGHLRTILRKNYAWALKSDRTYASSHQHFWYHSEDNGEQRRGDRITDPFEEFESFIDHFGLVQRLASVLTSYDDEVRVGEVVLRHPDLHFAISRVQYLDGLPYAEIRDCLADRDFMPSNLIRFFLACLGIRSSTPLSIRYVRGTFFQGSALPEDLLTDQRSGQSSHFTNYSEAV